MFPSKIKQEDNKRPFALIRRSVIHQLDQNNFPVFTKKLIKSNQ